MPYSTSPWFLRGGSIANASYAGLFSFNSIVQESGTIVSARAVLPSTLD